MFNPAERGIPQSPDRPLPITDYLENHSSPIGAAIETQRVLETFFRGGLDDMRFAAHHFITVAIPQNHAAIIGINVMRSDDPARAFQIVNQRQKSLATRGIHPAEAAGYAFLVFAHLDEFEQLRTPRERQFGRLVAPPQSIEEILLALQTHEQVLRAIMIGRISPREKDSRVALETRAFYIVASQMGQRLIDQIEDARVAAIKDEKVRELLAGLNLSGLDDL